MNTEAAYFTEMSERDDPMPTLLALQAEHGDALTPDIVRAAGRVRMDAIDTEARRHFSVYAAEARINGYGFQASLIKNQAVAAAQDDLQRRMAARTDFVRRFGQALTEKADGAARWNWFDAAKAVGMQGNTTIFTVTPLDCFMRRRPASIRFRRTSSRGRCGFVSSLSMFAFLT